MNFWKIFGRDSGPTHSQEQRAFYTKGFQKLWVAGTMGAYFTALASSIPKTITRFGQGRPPSDDIALISLSYGYLLWLLFYFLISTTSTDHPAAGRRGWDVAFDVTQSIGGLIAAFFLGFVGERSPRVVTPYFVTNIVIFLICAASRYLFGRKEVDRLREIGAVISLIAIVLCVVLEFGRGLIISLAVCQILLLILLGFYSWICFNEARSEAVPISATAALATASAAAANAATALTTASVAMATAASHAAKADQAISDATQSLAKAHKELN